MKDEMIRPVARSLLRSYQVRIARSRDLAEAISRGILTSWSDQESICKEGEPSSTMEVVLKGRVRVLKRDTTGQNKELAILKAPTMIGHMGMVDGSMRSATCIAIGSVGSISIDLETFQSLLGETSNSGAAFRHLILSSLSMQLTTANDKIRNLIVDMEAEKQNQKQSLEEAVAQTQKASDDTDGESSAIRLMKIAGVLDGWQVDSDGVNDIEFVVDEDMKRTIEARKKLGR